MEKNNLAIISITIALVALLIIISSISFAVLSASGKDASVNNIIDPLSSFSQPTDQAGTTIIHVGNGDDSDSDDDDDDNDTDSDPEIELGSTIYIQEDTNEILNMDSYASDSEDSHSELTYTIISPTNDDVIAVSYNNTSREVTLDAEGNAGDSDTLTIRVEDTDGNTAEDSVTVEITSGSSSDGPSITAIPDVYMMEDGTEYLPQSLDYYVSDPDDNDDDLTWTVSGNTNINVNIDSNTRNVTFTVSPEWSGSEHITFRAEDDDGNYDTETIMVDVTAVDDPAQWNSLSNQEINEDSADGTIVYSNILSRASDIDNSITMSVVSTHSNYDLSIVGNDLIISNLQSNWYGTETVTLDANGITNTFQLNVRQLFDDYHQVCGVYECQEWYD
ncbi:hypothetical protein GF378_01695 [Candidatus Pacearchaeota archaeon]|nr:hypothetical protein [Candidatus Pacearchaeota archaeon]